MLTSFAINYQYRPQLFFPYKQNFMPKQLLINRVKSNRQHLHLSHQRNRTDLGPSGTDYAWFVCSYLMGVMGSLKPRGKRRRSGQDSWQVFDFIWVAILFPWEGACLCWEDIWKQGWSGSGREPTADLKLGSSPEDHRAGNVPVTQGK